MTEGKIAVIGEKQIVTAFKAIGFDTFFADNALVTTDILRNLVKENTYAVIFITEDVASQMSDTLEILKSRSYPIVVPLPTLTPNGYGMECIKKDVEKAIGVDILFNKD
ncbi:MAG: V-type ATP synthase subunit F [Clostridiales bacterium]|nr:V-type ATP synthase subunit F [Clostridiales bacterium]